MENAQDMLGTQYIHDYRIIFFINKKKYAIQIKAKNNNIWEQIFSDFDTIEEAEKVLENMRLNEEFILIKSY